MATLDKKAPGLNGFKYKPRFGIVVVCEDETHQEHVYRHLTGLGYKVKVVAV